MRCCTSRSPEPLNPESAMKTKFTLFILATALVLGGALHAADPGPKAAATPLPAPKEMAALEHFLDLTDADLDQMQQVIARIRAMSPAERAKLRKEIQEFRQLPETQRRKLQQGWGRMDSELQDGWRRMMHSATPERRAEIQAQMQAQPPGNKAEFRRHLVEEFLKQEAKK